MLKELQQYPMLDNYGCRCKVGDFKLSSGYNLGCQFVFHVVAPCRRRFPAAFEGQVVSSSDHLHWEKNARVSAALGVLGRCYRKVIAAASHLGQSSISLPALGTGINSFDHGEVASVALHAIQQECADLCQKDSSCQCISSIEIVVQTHADALVWYNAATNFGWSHAEAL